MMLRLVVSILIALTLTGTAGLAQGSAVPEGDRVEVRNYTLTMDKVSNFFVTVSAVTQALKKDPALKKESDAKTAEYNVRPGVDTMSEILSKSPKMLSIVRSHGFTPRGFALTEFSVFQTMMAVQAIQGGSSMAEIVAAGEANQANIRLFQAHKAEIAALEKKYPLEE